jgi:hypothetical protein
MISTPPRFVPTLTEVVHPASPAAVGGSLSPEETSASRTSEMDIWALENQLVHRVLQRVDLILERRLREAVGQLILEHTETLAPQLRVEIESVVRQSVSQALAQEVANVPPTPGAGG